MTPFPYSNTRHSYFESIRPFLDSEVQDVLKRYFDESHLKTLLGPLLPEELLQKILANLSEITTIEQFKTDVVKQILGLLLKQTTTSIEASGDELLDGLSTNATFISNHRDIILDSAILNFFCFEHQYPYPRIAIGDNLVQNPIIKCIVRLCDAFMVLRSTSIKEMLIESRRLSDYIRTSIYHELPVWIAQREGRAKDNDDRTQTALLKMLAMSGSEATPIPNLATLNITPISISYEFDPCDALKARELVLREKYNSYQKSEGEDIKSMKTGLLGFKGRVHFTFHPALSLTATEALNKNEQLTYVAKQIDRNIHQGYKHYPINYICYDLYHNEEVFGTQYSTEEKEQTLAYLHKQAKEVASTDATQEEIIHKMIGAYAMTLQNALATE